MSEYYLRSMEASELKNLYPRIEKDFEQGEYPPLNVLDNQLQQGSQKGYVLYDGKNDLAYSFCAASSTQDYILITLLAVFQEHRGIGVGSAFLDELHRIYVHKHAIIVEVEKPEEAKTEEERDKRIRRIKFYEQKGYCLVKGIEYVIWDIPMHLMVCSINICDATINEEIKQIMHQIYFRLLGNQFINKMQFKE